MSMEQDEATPLLGTIQAPHTRPKVLPQVLATFFACLSSVSCGLVLGYTSPALPTLREEGILDKHTGAWFSSVAAVGAVVGGCLGGYFAESVGRKTTVMLTAIPYVLGWLLIACTLPVTLFIGRVLTGIAMGMTTVVTPMYIAEIAFKEHRGKLGSCLQIGTTIGVLLSYTFGSVITQNKPEWLAIVSAIFPTLLVFCMCPMPETPRWLLMHSTDERALEALTWLRGRSPAIYDEYNDIDVLLEKQSMERPMSLRTLSRPKFYKPLIMSIVLMVVQQFSGINAVIFNAQDLFKAANISNGAWPSIVMAIVQVLFTVIAGLLIDRAGRKVLLIVSGIIMIISCVTFGTYFYLTTVDKVTNIAPLAVISLCIYICGFSLGWGPIPWIYMSEVFPVKTRGLASAIASQSNWTCVFIVTQCFIYLEEGLHKYGTFWFFGGVCVAGVAFVAKFLLETKGRSLEQIEAEFEDQEDL